jgi:U4/U6.U5 tri-snRNP-associated protein 2
MSSSTTSVAGNTTSKKRKKTAVQDCPYLDTIHRDLLDFDMEPSCCVTLEAGPHVYACLVCGKFFRGRGPQTPAYLHAVDQQHYCFVHLQEGTFYCLPESYEIVDSSLDDISAALHPTFSKLDISELDANTKLARDWFGRRYLPGFIGMNNLDKTDGINAMVQALAHVKPLRDFFLQQTHRDLYAPQVVSTKKKKKLKPPQRYSHLVLAFGELVRKMWSNQRLKHAVDPQRLVQEISVASHKRFGHSRADMGDQLAWFLHQLHIGLGGGGKRSSIVTDIFQGRVQVTTRSIVKVTNGGGAKEDVDGRLGSDDEEDEESMEKAANEELKTTIQEKTTDTKFLQLTLEIPEKPLFKDDEGGLVIPQEPLANVLCKFDGVTFSDALNGSTRCYKLKRLPPYLILHLQRFTSNSYAREKNPTIVAFPVKNFDLSRYVDSDKKQDMPPPTQQEVDQMSIQELKAVLQKYNQGQLADKVVEKHELVQVVSDFCAKSLPDMLTDKYDLVANITHASNDVKQGDPLQEGAFKCHVQHRGQWYETQDLHVQETMPQLIGLSESYVLIFERKGSQPSN